MELPHLNFPAYKFKFKAGTSGGQSLKIFDIVREKYVSLTQEEWVRQHLLHFLVQDRAFPRSLTSVEKQVIVNGMPRRFDVLVYSRDLRPLLLAECKAPGQEINQQVFDQAARYNRQLRSPFLLVSNGLISSCVRVDLEQERYHFLENIPFFEELQ